MAPEDEHSAPPAKRVRLSTVEELKNGTSAGAERNGKAEEEVDQDTQLGKELKAGITSYISPDTPGFVGTLKQRYTDFLVNEILPSGKVLHLQSISTPAKQAKQGADGKEEQKSATAVKKNTQNDGNGAAQNGNPYEPVS